MRELREIVFKGSRRLSRLLALGLLSRKSYPQKLADLERVLIDEEEAPRLRSMAATALGAMRTPAALKALERGLQAEDAVTLSGIVKAFAVAGTVEHLPLLDRLAVRSDSVGQGAKRALAVITDRIPTASADESSRLERSEVSSEMEPIRIKRSVSTSVAEALDRQLPGSRALTTEGSISIQCHKRSLVFLFYARSQELGLRILDDPGEVGVLAELFVGNEMVWELRYRVFVRPQVENLFEMLVTTNDGRPVFAGNGQRGSHEATFELFATKRPGATSVDVQGHFDGTSLRFDVAQVALRRQPARQPSSNTLGYRP